MEGSKKADLQFKDEGLVHDNQFTGNQVNPNINELAGVVNVENKVVSFGADENDRLPELHESAEPDSTKRNGRYNLRKSLAWDSAFFTSAGVLDPEEMSSMITGPDKADKHLLPGIEEDITGSTESISTLHSDNLTLESLDDDLFLDIRASIQRSSKKASSFRNSGSKTAVAVVDNGSISSLRKEDLSSQNKNPKPVLKKTSGLQAVRMSKCQPKQSIGKLGSGKELKQDSVQSQMKSIAKIGESKPPKAISRPNPALTATIKRDSMGTGRARSESGSSKLGTVSSRATQPSKVTTVNGARRVLPKPAISSKSSSLGSSSTSRVQSTRSSISSDSSSSISSEAPGKSPLMTSKRNLVKSKSAAIALPSKTIPKTPSRAPLKNKPPSSTLSAYLMSNKISSSVSPASSISEWSSASSSSMVNQRSCNLRTSLDASSCRSMDSDVIHSDLKNHSTDQRVDGHENLGNALLGNSSKKSSTQTGTVQAPMRPTGLRMPSPKIGHFDVVKSSARTPTRPPQSQPGLRTMFPKNGAVVCSPTRSSNIKLKSGNVPTARTVSALANIKPDCLKATPPASLPEKSNAPGNDSCVSTDLNDPPPSMFLEVKGIATEVSSQNGGEVLVEHGVEQVIDEGLGAIVHENKGDLKSEMDLNMHKLIGNMKIATVEKNSVSGSEYIGQRGNGDVLINRNSLEKEMDLNMHKLMNIGDMKIATVEESNASGSEFIGQSGHENVLINHNHLENKMDLNMHKLMNTGDMKIATVEESNASGSECIGQSGHEDVLINQNHLENEVDLRHELMNTGDTEIAAVEENNSSGSEYIGQRGNEDVLINHNHLENEMDLNMHKLMKIATVEESNASGSECIGQSGHEDVLINQNHLENEVDLNRHELMNIGDTKISTVEESNASGSECIGQSGHEDVLINQNHLENEVDLNRHELMNTGDTEIAAVEENNSSGSEYIGQRGNEDVLINHNHLENEMDLNMHKLMKIATVEESNASGSECIGQSGHEDVLINQNHLENEVDLNRHKLMNIGDTKIATVEESNASGSECIGQSGHEDVLINQNHIENEVDLNRHELMNIGDMKIATVEESNASGSECIGQSGHEDVLINQNHLENEVDLNRHKLMNIGDTKIATVEESNASGSECIGQSGHEDVMNNQNHIENEPFPVEADDKENGHVKYQGEEFKEHTRDMIPNISYPKVDVLSDISGPVLSFPATASQSSPNRAPFAPKNFICNDDCVNMSKDLANQIEDKTAYALSSSEQKENS